MKKWWKNPEKKIEVGQKISQRLTGKKKNKGVHTTFKGLFNIKRKTGCYIFNGYTNSSGYGYKKYRGKLYLVHRLAYHITYGQLTKNRELFVNHTCHNPSCINPKHLYISTMHENIINRMRSNVGLISKLSPEQRQEIKDLFFKGTPRSELSKMYKTSPGVVNFLIDIDR